MFFCVGWESAVVFFVVVECSCYARAVFARSLLINGCAPWLARGSKTKRHFCLLFVWARHNILKVAGNTVTKNTIGNVLHRNRLKSCSAHVQVCLKYKHLNKKVWEQVPWLDKIQIEVFCINSTHHVWKKKNAKYTQRTPNPWSSMEVETSWIVALFLLKVQD